MDATIIRTTIAIAAGLLLFLVGVYVGGHPGTLPSTLRDTFVDDERAVRAELEDEIKDNFYKDVDSDKLDEGALQGMVDVLDDRFSGYITPDQAKIFEDAVSGEFEGVGMSVEKHRLGLLVIRVFEDSPAEKAGIRKNDVISEVNGDSIAGEQTQVATGKIKGPAGTEVELTVLPQAEVRKERTIEVERARIEVPVVDSRTVRRGGRKLAVVELVGFSEGAHGKLREEIDRRLEDGAEGLVLDLRGNGGGLLREAVLVSSVFIEDGRIVSTKGRTKPERVFEAEGDAIDEDIPIVVLVDRGSASASEIVTGALRDRKRATTVGVRTFGKGVFQEVEPLSNGGILDLTVGSYYLPSGENISDKGIKPEIEARDKPRTKRDEALPVALRALADKVE